MAGQLLADRDTAAHIGIHRRHPRRRRLGGLIEQLPQHPRSPLLWRRDRAIAGHLEHACLPEQPAAGRPFLQSSRLGLPEQTCQVNRNLLKKMMVLLKEYGIGDGLLATRSVCDAYDDLRKSMLCLLSLQSAISKREKQLVAAQQQQAQQKEAK